MCTTVTLAGKKLRRRYSRRKHKNAGLDKRGVLVEEWRGEDKMEAKVNWNERRDCLLGLSCYITCLVGIEGGEREKKKKRRGYGGSEGSNQLIRRTPAQDPANDLFASNWAGSSIVVDLTT